jgi:hypothetical protein
VDQYEMCGLAAGALAAVAFIPYVISILRSKTKPSRVSWSIWLFVGVIIFVSYRSVGATTTTWVTISYVLGPLIVVMLAIPYGVGGWGKLDIFCLSGAILGALLWWIYDSPIIALTMNVLMDFCGFLPTIQKSWNKPEQEDRTTWTISTSSAVLNLFALREWKFAFAVYPVFMFLGIGCVSSILWWKWLTRKA